VKRGDSDAEEETGNNVTSPGVPTWRVEDEGSLQVGENVVNGEPTVSTCDREENGLGGVSRNGKAVMPSKGLGEMRGEGCDGKIV
jgi:hypothetical protein